MYNNHVIHFGAFGDFHIPLAKLSMGEKSTLVSNFHLTPNLQLSSENSYSLLKKRE